ncbi:MAG: class I SAM-dependent methyltransferase [Eubacterium sp.]
MDAVEHYDKLIEENNDPVYDPDPIKAYMNKWDGQVFIDAMQLDKTKNVLEIGVGTGRIAIKTVPLCKKFYGIDISPKTIERARHNLSIYQNIELICDDFMQHNFSVCFDAIYSTLTFMHIKDKEKCINRIYSLLNMQGRFILSVDKSQNKYIDYGDRKIKIYPDNPTNIKAYILKSGLTLLDCMETEFAYIFVSIKE